MHLGNNGTVVYNAKYKTKKNNKEINRFIQGELHREKWGSGGGKRGDYVICREMLYQLQKERSIDFARGTKSQSGHVEAHGVGGHVL